MLNIIKKIADLYNINVPTGKHGNAILEVKYKLINNRQELWVLDSMFRKSIKFKIECNNGDAIIVDASGMHVMLDEILYTLTDNYCNIDRRRRRPLNNGFDMSSHIIVNNIEEFSYAFNKVMNNIKKGYMETPSCKIAYNKTYAL